jgi:hypothetical protein
MKDVLDSRILGAIRFADALTGTTVQSPLSLELGELHAVRNRSGVYVVRRAPGMDALSKSFDLTGAPAITPVAFPIKVSDPQHFYMPRTASVTLPRSTSVPATDSASIFQPQQIMLYPAPAATGRSTWASVFVTVSAQSDANKKLAFVLIQAQQVSDSSVLASSFTDFRGEGQLSLAVPGIRANTGGGAGVVAVGTDVNIVAIYDPAMPLLDSSGKATGFVPDPDDLLRRAGDASMKRAAPARVTVQAGQTKSIAITIALS